MAMAHRAHDWRSPVERSMSISRASGVGETSEAMAMSSSVVFPRADRTATTRRPRSFWATMRRAARLSRPASATDVPPNFMTTVAGTTSQGSRGVFGLALAATLLLTACGGGRYAAALRMATTTSRTATTPARRVTTPARPSTKPPEEALAAVRKLSLKALAARVLVVAAPGDGPTARLGPRAWGGVLGTGGPAGPWVLARADELGLPPASRRGGQSVARLRDAAERAARALRAQGARAVLAPPADVSVPAGAVAPRSFGQDPARVARAARAEAAGLARGGLAPVPGSFPGEGAASADPDVTTATVGQGLPQLRRRDLAPFRALAPRVPGIQVSNALYAAFDGVTPAALLPEADVRLLRGETGFAGAAVSPELGALVQVTRRPPGAVAVDALRAGIDLVLVDGTAADARGVFRAVLAAATKGALPRPRLEEAAARALALREATR